MPIYSLSFIFLFLPASILLFYITPKKFKPITLTVISAVFYLLVEPSQVIIMLLNLISDYILATIMDRYNSVKTVKKICLVICIVKNLSLIIGAWLAFEFLNMLRPLGISIYTLTAMGYLIDLYKGEAPYEKNIFKFMVFCMFFGKMYVTLVTYNEFMPQFDNSKPNLSNIGDGIAIFIKGLAKKIIFGDNFLRIYSTANQLEDVTILSSWCRLVFLAFAVYFLLSAYSDMAIGLGKIFGMNLPKNSYYPYQAHNAEDFFDRFNITINKYISRYVYFNLGANKNGFLADSVNTIFSGMLMGLWFGLTVNFMAWGIYFAIYIIFERYILSKVLKFIPLLFLRVYSFTIVLISFTIFGGENLTHTVIYIKNLLGLAPLPMLNNSIMYLITSNYLLIILGFIFCTSLVNRSAHYLKSSIPKTFDCCVVVTNVGLLILTVSFIL